MLTSWEPLIISILCHQEIMRVLPVLLFLIATVAESLMLSRVLVPQYKLYGEDAILKCDYDMGRDRLYAVKWYKDNEEFFRYVPRFNPPIYTHTVEGVRVDNTKSNDKRVLLRSLTVRSSGVYRCEVSAEAPSFASTQSEGRMTVVYLPKDPPQITGHLRQEYEVGNMLDLNCTSAKSFPPAKLSWYINETPVHVPPGSISIYPATAQAKPEPTASAEHHHIVYQQQSHYFHPPTAATFNSVASSLMISSLRLQLQLENHHFEPKGTAKVRCVARISPLFWQDGDEKILSGNQHWSQSGRKNVEYEDYSAEQTEVEGRPGRASSKGSGTAHNNKVTQSGNVRFNSKHKGHQQQHQNKENQVQYRHQNHHQGNHRHQEQEIGNAEEEDDGEDEYYGLGLPAFQREALVLVRGSCSSLKPMISSYFPMGLMGLGVHYILPTSFPY